MSQVYSQKFDRFKSEVKQALEDEDDALAAYTRFVEWLVEYEQEHGQLPSSNGPNDSDLLLVLEEAVRKLKDDNLCLSDRRYMKLWTMFAKRVDAPEQIYAYMLSNKIGTMFSPLYEEYAKVLERNDKLKEANGVYQQGISSRVRGVDKLKKCYSEFQERVSSGKTLKRAQRDSKGESSNSDSFRVNPLKNFGVTKPSEVGGAPLVKVNSTSNSTLTYDPYIHMRQPVQSGSKRPERLQFDLELLFKDGQEFCVQEARARSLGLLEKKWAPLQSSGQEFQAQDYSDGKSGSKSTRNLTSDNHMLFTTNITSSFKVGGGAEPTVTINTKEALREVFGMYNSPERSVKLGPVGTGKSDGLMLPPPPPLGSKHAPVRKVDPIAPVHLQSSSRRDVDSFANENADARSTPFKPFVDEDIRKENATPAPLKFKPFVDGENEATPAPGKFKPFVDEGAVESTPHITPGSRRALSLRDISTPVAPTKESSNENGLVRTKSLSSSTSGVFSNVFTPIGKATGPLIDPQTSLKSSISVFRDPEPESKQKSENVLKTSVFAPPDSSKSQLGSTGIGLGVFSRPGEVFQRPPAFKPSSVVGSSTPKGQTLPEPVFLKAGLSVGQGGLGSGPPVRGVFAPKPLSQSGPVFSAQTPLKPIVNHEESTGNDTVDDSFDDDDNGVETQPETEEYAEENFDDEGYSYGPDYRMGGGRCGAYDVMTPIAERTMEFTSTRAFSTPNQQGSKQSGVDAVEAARLLALELKEDEKASRPRTQDDIDDDELSDADVDDVVERTGTLSLADAIFAASSFKPTNPCVPSDPQIITTLLSLFPLEPEFHDHRTETVNLLEGIQKFTNKSSRRGSSKSNSSRPSDEGGYEIQLAGHIFEVRDKLGEGGFGAVFMAKDVSAEEDDDCADDEYANIYALKVVRPRNIWEYHILRSIHNTLPSAVRRSIIQPHSLYAFKDESFLVLDLCRQGTLLDVVNRAAQAGVMQQGACLDELLVMFFTIELLRFVDAMHAAGYIHGDLKIDNCLLRLEEVPGVASAWSGLYQPSGQGGWSYKGIKMIDFGRTINTRLFPAGQQFIADWKTDARDCVEMNQGKPWTYQTDYYGLAGIIHCMLYGKYFEASTVVQGPDGRYKLTTSFKRYWQVNIWTQLFDALLNPTMMREDKSLPICQELGEIRVEMEEWLQNNCNRSSISLKSLLKKVELSILEL